MGVWGNESLANDYGADLRITILDELDLYPEEENDDEPENCSDCLDNSPHKELYDFLYSDSCTLPSQELVDKFKNDLLPNMIEELGSSSVACHEAHCLALFVLENKIKISKTMNKKLIVAIGRDHWSHWSEPEVRKEISDKLVHDLIKLQKSA